MYNIAFTCQAGVPLLREVSHGLVTEVVNFVDQPLEIPQVLDSTIELHKRLWVFCRVEVHQEIAALIVLRL